MTYTVKEIFYTLQGEGYHVGTPAIFCRFAGCNLTCAWCDTDFQGGTRYETAEALVAAIAATGPGRFVVLTGGEPALQVDAALTAELKRAGFYIAIETNGMFALPRGIDWVCVSPKAGFPPVLKKADEIKVVYPQDGALELAGQILAYQHFVQPMDGVRGSTKACIEFVKKNPQWRLSLQTHKLAGFP